ncbi:MAG: ribonuclease P protein component 1 [Candidatus Aenigmarchaeota archaeon ex4484_56]|nr:MAG: ribonuclease P protein component 1 [Candidatus Aenigmarchaeota archaeon ex4484_56]
MNKDKIIEFLRGEFIGEKVEIIDSTNRDLINIKGRIIDETKNMFELETDKGIKKVQKKICKFKFLNEKIIIDGKIINYRPEDRLIKKFKDW